MTILRLVLGDQLTSSLSALEDIDKDNDVVMMAEVMNEASYVKHHPKKIAFIFSAMRHFADTLKDKNIQLAYSRLDDAQNTQSLREEAQRRLKECKARKLVITHPGEYRLIEDMNKWQEDFDVEVEIREDTRFLCSRHGFAQWAEGRKTLTMEYFYRQMRQKYDILMNKDNEPEGGEWNFDKKNRKALPEDLSIPSPASFKPDDTTKEVLELVAKRFDNHFGELEPFNMAVNREQALEALDQFLQERLPNFGDYQDAMKTDEPWLFHSHLSYALNSGLLNPDEVINKAQKAYYNGDAPINAVEGFIRQVLGWREFIRGIYWYYMPGYATRNALSAQRSLPDFFWGAPTDMKCLSQSIGQTRKYAYAHHIQRLMVIGNFALLAGLNPKEVNEWYLCVYFDAYEWVEMPNVQGMILYADDGAFASKSYAASGAYIDKMSDYCQSCVYNVKEKTGKNACPFNYLYWDFLARNEEKLRSNHRMAMIYKTWEKMAPSKKNAIRQSANAFYERLEKGEV